MGFNRYIVEGTPKIPCLQLPGAKGRERGFTRCAIHRRRPSLKATHKFLQKLCFMVTVSGAE